MQRWLTALLALLLFAAAGLALAEGEFPALNEAGFLDEGEFVYENDEDGVWRYVSATLKVEILRHSSTDPVRRWYEAEVWTRGEEKWFLSLAVEGKHVSMSKWPWIVARDNRNVLAINNDYCQGRYPSKNNSVGVIVREGKILWDKTRKPGYVGFPNLDTLALFPNGMMQVYDNAEHTGQEYLDMGATDVLAFGPWLIRDGQLNEQARIKIGNNAAPRTAIGMVEPGHYWAMMLEGRSKQSKGGPVWFLAERMLEKGCVTAFNLDGGETACMLFMGRQLNEVGGTSNKGGSARRSSELLAVGYSELIEPYNK